MSYEKVSKFSGQSKIGRVVVSSVLLVLLVLGASQSSWADYWGLNKAPYFNDGAYTLGSRSTRVFPTNVPMNQFFQSSIHNAYEKHGVLLYDVLKNVSTNIEIDFYDAKNTRWYESDQGRTYMSGDWYVRHGTTASEDVMCIDDGDHDFLSECLDVIAKFHKEHQGRSSGRPLHNLITIWMDKKQNWQPEDQCDTGKPVNNPCRRPVEFDQLIDEKLGRENLFTPADFLAYTGKANLRAAADSTRGWPIWEDLSGKIMIVLTDHSNANANLNEYVKVRGNSASAFVAVKMDESDEVDNPKGMSGHQNEVVFYNLSPAKRNHGPEIYSKNRISRTWSVDFNNEANHDYMSYLIQHGAGDDYESKSRYDGVLHGSGVPLFMHIVPRHALDAAINSTDPAKSWPFGLDSSGTDHDAIPHLWSVGSQSPNQRWAAIPQYRSRNRNNRWDRGLYSIALIDEGQRLRGYPNGPRLAHNEQKLDFLWYIEKLNSGDYQIKKADTLECLEFPKDNIDYGVRPYQSACLEETDEVKPTNQQFFFGSLKKNRLQIRDTELSGEWGLHFSKGEFKFKLLEPKNGKRGGADQWIIEHNSVGGEIVVIRHIRTNKLLTYNSAKKKLELRPDHFVAWHTSAHWQVKSVPGRDEFVTIKNKKHSVYIYTSNNKVAFGADINGIPLGPQFRYTHWRLRD